MLVTVLVPFSPYLCSVGPAGYNIRQQAQRSTNALKLKTKTPMVKHMLRTHFLTLHIEFFFLLSPCSFSNMRTVVQKNMTSLCCWPLSPVQPSWAESHSPVFSSNWGTFTVAKCEVTFHDTRYEKKPCVCALWSISVLELKATADLGSNTRLMCAPLFQPLMEIQVNLLIQTRLRSGRPTSFPALLLSWFPPQIIMWSVSLVPFCHWHKPSHRLLCWLAGRTS